MSRGPTALQQDLSRAQQGQLLMMVALQPDAEENEFLLQLAMQLRAEEGLRYDRRLMLHNIPIIVSLDQVPDDPYYCHNTYRFAKPELRAIMEYLTPFCPQGDGNLRYPRAGGAGCHRYNLLECLLAALNQFSQLETLFNMGERFGRPIERLSEMTNAFGDFLLFDTPEYSKLRDPSNFVDLFAQTADAFCSKGMPLANCWGCIDGKLFRTGSATDRLIEDRTFSFKDKSHGMNWLTIGSGDGLIIGVFGPVGGRRNDAHCYAEHQVADTLAAAHAAASAHFPHRDMRGETWCIYGDAAFPRGPHMAKGFVGAITQREADYNSDCNTIRVIVEWSYHHVVSLFPYIDTARKMRIQQNACGTRVVTAIIMHNWHCCAYGNQTSKYFEIYPPTLQEYFAVQ